jgi:anti-sigma B factor antagonist
MSIAPTVLALGPDLTIAQAAVHRQQLLELWPPQGDVALDLAGVTDFDSSGVQLLLACARSLGERGDQLQLQTPSAVVRDALQVLGLSAHFGAATA